MAKGFYLKLALNNLKRNRRSLVPYFIAAAIMISVYSMVLTIIFSHGLNNVPDSVALRALFTMGIIILTLFEANFMIYINSFLIKQRKKEFALYGILGLEKRHVGRVMLWENLIINGAALALGITAAAVFGWLIFLLLMKSIRVSVDSYFSFPIEAVYITVIVFAVIFFLILLINLFQVRMSNPIDLLKSKNKGEKKVRFTVPMTLLGIVSLAWAYYSSLTVVNPLAALNKFFIAVLLVIMATYLLFTSGSNALLKLLKKNRKFYYKADNFITISGMMHRMKQNASGLASICILSTMVLVTVSTCIALFIGQEETFRARFSDDFIIKVDEATPAEEYTRLKATMEELTDKYNVSLTDFNRYFSIEGYLAVKNNKEIIPGEKLDYFNRAQKNIDDVNIIVLKDYNRICKTDIKLSDNQLLLLADIGYSNLKDVTLGSVKYDVTVKTGKNPFMNIGMDDAFKEIYMVVKDKSVGMDIAKAMKKGLVSAGSMKIVANIDGSADNSLSFARALEAQYKNIMTKSYSYSDIYTDKAAAYSMYGGLLFMGAFFTILFLCATVLIIYFKQISEGYDDKERFETLQKVGMGDHEVKRTINKQILIVFFLPLVSALIHVVFAANMIIKMLEVFDLYNISLTIICIAASCSVFTLAYVIVFRLTAATYYRIVKW